MNAISTIAMTLASSISNERIKVTPELQVVAKVDLVPEANIECWVMLIDSTTNFVFPMRMTPVQIKLFQAKPWLLVEVLQTATHHPMDKLRYPLRFTLPAVTLLMKDLPSMTEMGEHKHVFMMCSTRVDMVHMTVAKTEPMFDSIFHMSIAPVLEFNCAMEMSIITSVCSDDPSRSMDPIFGIQTFMKHFELCRTPVISDKAFEDNVRDMVQNPSDKISHVMMITVNQDKRKLGTIKFGDSMCSAKMSLILDQRSSHSACDKCNSSGACARRGVLARQQTFMLSPHIHLIGDLAVVSAPKREIDPQEEKKSAKQEKDAADAFADLCKEELKDQKKLRKKVNRKKSKLRAKNRAREKAHQEQKQAKANAQKKADAKAEKARQMATFELEREEKERLKLANEVEAALERRKKADRELARKLKIAAKEEAKLQETSRLIAKKARQQKAARVLAEKTRAEEAARALEDKKRVAVLVMEIAKKEREDKARREEKKRTEAAREKKKLKEAACAKKAADEEAERAAMAVKKAAEEEAERAATAAKKTEIAKAMKKAELALDEYRRKAAIASKERLEIIKKDLKKAVEAEDLRVELAQQKTAKSQAKKLKRNRSKRKPKNIPRHENNENLAPRVFVRVADIRQMEPISLPPLMLGDHWKELRSTTVRSQKIIKNDVHHGNQTGILAMMKEQASTKNSQHPPTQQPPRHEYQTFRNIPAAAGTPEVGSMYSIPRYMLALRDSRLWCPLFGQFSIPPIVNARFTMKLRDTYIEAFVTGDEVMDARSKSVIPYFLKRCMCSSHECDECRILRIEISRDYAIRPSLLCDAPIMCFCDECSREVIKMVVGNPARASASFQFSHRWKTMPVRVNIVDDQQNIVFHVTV